MSPEQWNKVVDLFHAALEKTGPERIALLDSACSENPALRPLVEQMLQDDKAASSFLNESPLQHFAANSSSSIVSDRRVIPGLRFGRYEVVGLIGRGGMGEVWKGRDPELDRLVALKFLAPEAPYSDTMDRLIREARAASALNHPNVVTVYEVIRHEETSIIVMELVDGTALRAICGSPQPLDRVVQIGIEIAKALAAAHAHGIVHCDIKPENILLRSDGYLKVLDFGLARQIGGEPATMDVGGTLRYMSPEQARGETLSPATDIFSFGLVLYELATGQHAFPRNLTFEGMRSISGKDVAAPCALNPLIPPQLNLLILAMLAGNAAERPAAQDVVHTLREVERALDTSRANVATAEAKFAGHRKWLAACLLLLVAGCATWLWKRHAVGNRPAFYQVTTLVPENRATAAAISPDGKLAAYANVDGIFVRTIQTGEMKALPSPTDYVVDRLAWFSDGKKLAASGFSTLTNVPGIWLISITGAEPRLLRIHARQATPSPDGTRIAFTSQDRTEIWIIGTGGQNPRKLVGGPGEDTFPVIFWSPDARRVSFQRRHYSPNHNGAMHGEFARFYELTYESVQVADAKVTARETDTGMSSAAALPDGRILFLRYHPPSTDLTDQLWEVKTRLATGEFVAPPHQVMSSAAQNETHIYDMSAAANGSRILVLKRSDQNAVFIGDFDEASPRISNIRRLTFDERTSYPHAWTADSRSVIFESIRNGTWDIFVQDIDHHIPRALVATPLMEVLPHLTPDGRWILYSAAERIERGMYTLMRMPVAGGAAEKVPIGGPLDEFRCALRPGARCVLRTTTRNAYFTFFDLDPIKGKGRELARVKWTPNVTEDWDVSPDGTQVAIPIHDSQEAIIRVVDLQAGSTQTRERDVVLPGLSDLSGVVWSASGDGWFVTLNMSVGKRMVYVYPDGSFRSLGDIPSWAVPSPDGRRVAFVNTIIATNAWLIVRH